MNQKDKEKSSEKEVLQSQNPENNSSTKKNEKEDLPKSTTNKSGKTGG